MVKMEKIDRIGEENYNNFGILMKIVEYICYDDIWVEFQDEYKAQVHTTYKHFKKGGVKNPYDKTVYGVGYLGEGKYKTRGEDGKKTRTYKAWKNMLQRCYDPYFLNKEMTYIDCYVCEEWHNFQNFAKWFYENYYEIPNQRMHLDKDILIKGNKVYSPETCVFVPNRINYLFIKRDKVRGKYPIGVTYHKRKCALEVQCGIIDENGKGKRKHLGNFSLNKPFQAFYVYKIFKENYIKQVADEYKGMIPQKLYDAMYAYEVEIND